MAPRELQPIVDGWTAWTPGIAPIPARVPGTAAGALRDAGLWRDRDTRDLDAEEWQFGVRFPADPAARDEEVLLRLEGIATVFDATLNGELVAEGTSMFAATTPDVGKILAGDNELTIRCLPIRERLAEPRKPRARWRTRLVDDGNLRFFRTALLGRAPGFAPGPAPVGPWRPVVLERRRRFAVDDLTVRTRLMADAGTVTTRFRVRGLGGHPPERCAISVTGPTGSHRADLTVADGVASGEVGVDRPALWWPHTHGEPVLYAVRIHLDDVDLDAGKVGFRTLESPGDVLEEGVDLRVNDVPVFARGAVWTPVDFVGYAADPADVRAGVVRACGAGMNMLRVAGTGVYEDAAFHDACDELGVLVWQDFMFANLDYPAADPAFRLLVEREAREVLARIGGRPSLAIICGNSEVEQQAAMLGLDPAIGRSELFADLLPRIVREADTDALYVPSAPCGGDLPFRPDRGVANYYGVGAYLRPLEDARRANLRFASECLAFANVPDGDVVAAPRDNGADWDFADVRDHYFRLLYGIDPDELRRSEPERYLELSRFVSGEVMAEALGEWRRPGSRTRGAIVLGLRDILPGAGWGLLDDRGHPKVAWHHVRRALAPVAVWTTDEGLGGIDVHAANDRAEPLEARLRIALYRDFEHRIDGIDVPLDLAPHESVTHNVEGLLGRFVDASYAYRFGPPGHDLVVASLERDNHLLSQAVRFPVGRPLAAEPAGNLGLEATLVPGEGDDSVLLLRSRKLAYGVRVRSAGLLASEDAFCVEPGHERRISLHSRPTTALTVTALNLHGELPVTS